MNEVRSLAEALSSATHTILSGVMSYLPSVLGAVLLLVAGWLLARVLRALSMRAVLLVDTLLARVGAPAGVERLRVGRASAVLGAIIFWVVLLFFVTAATQVLGLQTFTDWLARLIDYLPTVAAGVLIVLAGYVLSKFSANLVLAAATRLEQAQRTVLARLVQAAILIGAILVGADQIGLKITFLAIFAAAVVGAIVGGLSLAVGLGARGYVANLIGAHHLKQAFAAGQTIRCAGHEGRILEVTATGVVIETAEGRVTLPGRIFNEEAIAVIVQIPRNG